MKQRKIYGIGETVLDIIFKENEPQTAKPGGSALNTSVTLGRLGLPVSFISEWGNDQVGQLIKNFLEENNVSTENAHRFSEGKSALALAFLDKNKNASYSFYKNFPEHRLNIEFPEIQENDIVLYCSSFAIDKAVRKKLFQFLTEARRANAILIYDPNFRKAHESELDNLKPVILENVSMADIVRGSDEDFDTIFNVKSSNEAYQKIKAAGCQQLVYTANKKGVYVHGQNINKKYSVPQIEPVSTIGAGDNFNAGIIYGLFKNNISKSDIKVIPEKYWDDILKWGIDFAKETCLGYDNYISKEYAESI